MNFQDFKNIYEKKPVREVANQVTTTPLASICVQTFQHRNFITDCLDNILNQDTTFSFEILLSEDDSPDGTREICLEYASRYPGKIRLFLHHRENLIKVLNEPTGNFTSFYNLFSARGRYIAVCEGDDYWKDPLKLQKQVDFLERNQSYSLVFHKYRLIDEKGSIIQGRTSYQPENDISQEDLIQIKHHPLFLTVCFRNNFKEYPVQVTEVINVDSFLVSVLGHVGKSKFQSGITPALHRVHSGGIWGKRRKDKKFKSKLLLYSKLKEYYLNDKPDLANYFGIAIENTKKMLFFYYLKNGRITAALQILFL